MQIIMSQISFYLRAITVIAFGASLDGPKPNSQCGILLLLHGLTASKLWPTGAPSSGFEDPGDDCGPQRALIAAKCRAMNPVAAFLCKVLAGRPRFSFVRNVRLQHRDCSSQQP